MGRNVRGLLPTGRASNYVNEMFWDVPDDPHAALRQSLSKNLAPV
jgi:hypothetical protein